MCCVEVVMCATAIMAVRTGADQGTVIFDKGVIWSNLRNDYVLTQVSWSWAVV